MICNTHRNIPDTKPRLVVSNSKPLASCLPKYAARSRRKGFPAHTPLDPRLRRDQLFPKDAIDLTVWAKDLICFLATMTTIAIWTLLFFAVTP